MTRSILALALTLGFLSVLGTPLRAAEGYTNTPKHPDGKWRVHDANRPRPRVITPGAQFSHQAAPPSDAVVLFDGKDFSKWQAENGEVQWKIENGYMETTKGIIRTKDEFGDFQLHLEFATPSEVKGKGQGRGNNGVNIFWHHIIQITKTVDVHIGDNYISSHTGSDLGSLRSHNTTT